MNSTTHKWTHRTLSLFTLMVMVMAFLPIGQVRTKADTLPSEDDIAPLARADRETIFAVTNRNNLVTFNSDNPSVMTSTKAITGLQTSESILGIDFRPATGQLYALGSTSRIYTVNTMTGAATAVGTTPFTPALSGTEFGFDFNPVPDRIRLVSNTGQDLRIVPTTGATVTPPDGMLSYNMGDANQGKTPSIVASGYTNTFAGSTSTTLYEVDSALDILVTQGSIGGAPISPNTGTLLTVGSLGIDITDTASLDISDFSRKAYGAFITNGDTVSKLYTVDLNSGKASLVGTIGVASGEAVRGIAVGFTGETLVGLTMSNKLVTFNAGTPGTPKSTVSITGLQMGENIVGIDYRPQTGVLFGVGSTNRVYTISLATGAATQVGTMPFTPALSGTAFGVDFNPVPDRIRLVSNTGQNLRLVPTTGALAATDTPLAYSTTDPNNGKTPSVVSAAYTNNVAGATTTTLYEIDSALDALVTQGSVGGTPVSPNAGTLFTVGALGMGLNTNDMVGFDISSSTGAAFASLTTAGEATSRLYTINLTTGAATMLGSVAAGETLRDLAVVVNVENVFAVTASNQLISFNRNTPGIINTNVPITGLQSGENILGIDFRPASSGLFGLGSTSRVYSINPVTGAATALSAAPFTPALNGTDYGFDFNPVPDRIRVNSNANQNLRLNPNNGTVAATDTNLVFAANDPNTAMTPNVVAAAYTNNFAGSVGTTLYVIDSNLDTLLTQGSVGGVTVSPNTGMLFTVGKLGVDTNNLAGFDISDSTGVALASLTTPGDSMSKLYTINLATGAATLVGAINVNEAVRDIAIANSVSADVGVTVAASATTVIAGSDITYNITVSNAGPDAANNTTLMAAVPANTTFKSTTSPMGITCTNPMAGGTGAVTCVLPVLQTGASANFSIVVTSATNVANNTMVNFTANVSSSAPDPNAQAMGGNNSASATTTVKLPGPTITAIKVSNTKLTATGSAFMAPVTIAVNGVAFAKPSKLKGTTMVTQMGKLTNGMSIKKAIPKGQAVMITFTNMNGGATTVPFTR